MQVEARHHATVLRNFGSAFEKQVGAGARLLDSSKVARRYHGVVRQMYVNHRKSRFCPTSKRAASAETWVVSDVSCFPLAPGYPHRNELLGRGSTVEEQKWLHPVITYFISNPHANSWSWIMSTDKVSQNHTQSAKADGSLDSCSFVVRVLHMKDLSGNFHELPAKLNVYR